MTGLTSSINNALSGLAVNSRLTETISSNVANALSEGYAPRTVSIGQRIVGGVGFGTTVIAVNRQFDPILQGERRGAEAELAKATIQTNFYKNIEAAVGLPDDPASFSGRLSNFGAGLLAAASSPDSEPRLQALLDSASSVALKLNAASDAVQQERMRADSAIAATVDSINATLKELEQLNTQILRTGALSGSSISLVDERTRLIDGLSELIPVKEVVRDNGTSALFTPGGAILLDVSAAELGFTPAGLITPDMSLGGGTLSGLTVNGVPVTTDANIGKIAGGKLAALFDVRDVQAPAVQTRLDAVARDLIERFESSAVDPTLTGGDPGLFTDNGNALVPVDEVGLSSRIAVNALVDPAQGGALWRLRAGLGATGPGDVGDASILNALSDALSATRSPATGGFTGALSATGVAGELIGGIGTSHGSFETQQSFATARAQTLITSELKNGVDTDAEMQRLLVVEQAFAANARVLSVIDELMQTLLRI